MSWKAGELAILITGIFLFVMSWVSELYFHFVAGVHEEDLGSNLFWRLEYSEILNSMTFLIAGIILIVLGIYLWWRRSSCEKIGFKGDACKSWKNKL